MAWTGEAVIHTDAVNRCTVCLRRAVGVAAHNDERPDAQ